MDIKAIEAVSQPGAVTRPSCGDTVTQVENSAAPASAQAELPQPASPLVESEQSRQPMEEAVSSIQQFAQSIQRNLNFALDDSTGRMVVKVTDGVSGEMVRQIPSEDALRLAESLDEVRSLLFTAEA